MEAKVRISSQAFRGARGNAGTCSFRITPRALGVAAHGRFGSASGTLKVRASASAVRGLAGAGSVDIRLSAAGVAMYIGAIDGEAFVETRFARWRSVPCLRTTCFVAVRQDGEERNGGAPVSFNDKTFGAIFPTRDGVATGSSNERQMLDKPGGAEGFKKTYRTLTDGSVVRCSTRNGCSGVCRRKNRRNAEYNRTLPVYGEWSPEFSYPSDQNPTRIDPATWHLVDVSPTSRWLGE